MQELNTKDLCKYPKGLHDPLKTYSSPNLNNLKKLKARGVKQEIY